MELYQKVGRKNELQNLQTQVNEQGIRLITRLVVVGCVMALSFLIGVIVILAQLFSYLETSPKSQTERLSLHQFHSVREPYMVCSSPGCPRKYCSVRYYKLVSTGRTYAPWSFSSRCAYSCVVLRQQRSRTLYIYLIAVKPNKLKYLETVKVRTKVGKLGPVRLALAGWLTWFAAVPVVLVCYLLAMKFMNSAGVI